MGHGHLSSHGQTYFWSSSQCRTAASQRAFSVGTRAAGDASQDGINAPGGGVLVAILRRDVLHRHLVVSGGGAGRIVEELRLGARARLTAASRWAGRGEAAGVVAARAGDGRRAGRRWRGRPARGRARGARAARRELGVLGGRREGWQECERVNRRQR